MVVICSGVFQSTLPVWGATYRAHDAKPQRGYFNPRSPCGERPRRASYASFWGYFNPRSPCGERPGASRRSLALYIFQSTLPVWGATIGRCHVAHLAAISIHAPRVGSDRPSSASTPSRANFNPRSPCGERRLKRYGKRLLASFQSTLPVWGATPTSAM